MSRCLWFLAVALLCIVVAALWSPAHAQFGFIGEKIKQKAQEKTEEAIDKAADGSEETGEAEADTAQAAAAEGKAGGGTATAEDMALYTKYDFVPGDRVIFFDDLSTEELGEFPSRWRLDSGVFEIANQGGKNYIWCSDQGRIRPRIATGPLPPKYTIEMEFYVKGGAGARGHWFYIKWLDSEDTDIGSLGVTDNVNTALQINQATIASKALAKELARGVHTMRVMATPTTMKCYIDGERVANVPAVEGFQPVDIAVYMDPWDDEGNPMLLGAFRYAEGGKTLREQLNEAGRIVSHGILFDSGSAKIKAESYKTLADISKLLTDDPELKLSIEGHTDSDGTDAANLTLSQNRADAVRTYLMDTYKIDGGRLTAKGWGEGKPIDVNTTPEGKANNRRVEFVKV